MCIQLFKDVVKLLNPSIMMQTYFGILAYKNKLVWRSLTRNKRILDYIIFFNLLSHPPRLHICFRLRKSKDGKLPKLPKTKKEALKIGVPEVYKRTEESGPFLR